MGHYICHRCLSLVPNPHICDDILNVRKRMHRMRRHKIRDLAEKRRARPDGAV